MFSTKNLFIQDNPTTDGGGLLLSNSLVHCIYTPNNAATRSAADCRTPKIYLHSHTAK